MVGAAVVAASRKPKTRQTTSCQTRRPMKRHATKITAPMTATSGIVMTNAVHLPRRRVDGHELAFRPGGLRLTRWR
jgi:hypothetical protein